MANETPAGAEQAPETPAVPQGATPAVPKAEAPAVPKAEAPVVPKAEAPAVPQTEAPVVPQTEATTADTDQEENEPAVKEGDWAGIRARIAKDNPKLEKRLARYSSIDSVVDALVEAQTKLSSGALKSALPKEATPEQLTAWREENGIPATPEDYDLTLPEGLVIGEADKPVVDQFVKVAHGMNLTPEQNKTAVSWYLNHQEQLAEEQSVKDLDARDVGEETLREVWGTETRLNKSLINNLINTAPEGVPEQLLGARLADGTPLGSHAGTLRWLADLSRQINPMATVVPGAGTNAAQAIETELDGIKALMKDHNSAYWKGDKADRLQARFRDLVDVQSRTKGQ